MPLQLMIAVATLALVLPPALSSFDSLQRQVSTNRIEQEVDVLLLASRQVASGGIGGVRILELDLDIRGLEKLRIGGPPGGGSESVTISYTTTWGREVNILADPVFHMSSVEGGSVLLFPERVTLRLSLDIRQDYDEDGYADRVVIVERFSMGESP